CTYTDVYTFHLLYMKMGEYFDKNPYKTIGAFNIIPINAWVSLVGSTRPEAQDEYIDALARSIPDVSNIGNGCFVGIDDLARGELCFFRGQLNEAEQYLKQSVDKAQARDQFIIQNRALAYLMRIAFFQGDFEMATARLKDMETMLSEKDYGIRYTMYDIAYAFYKMTLGMAEDIPDWLKGDFVPYAHPTFLENYGNRIRAQYHYQKRQYSALLAYLENEPKETILFARIEQKLLQALSLYQLKRRNEAIAALTEAYYLAEPNGLTVFFTQYGKDMRTLTAAARKDETCTIPRAWLDDINRKAAGYAKRQSHIVAQYRAAHNLETGIVLTKREIEVLNDLVKGLSRSEIAASQNVSVNTVKMLMSSMYDKLGVTTLPEAIRVAVDQKIL
ncbi:MAG: LuxR C-terminal-related transcriptional regulator, partial [Coriobacteriia bacterium]|nr:LuxR C-terminal-related transcriptional regulator [Coriobacteriia bacterium]